MALVAAVSFFLIFPGEVGALGSADSNAGSWPRCVLENQSPQVPQPVFADVRPLIKHSEEVRHRVVTYNSEGNIGMVLREKAHESGEFVDDVLPGSQAAAAGVRKGWIITDVNGKRFSAEEGLKDVASDFSQGKSAGSTIVVKYDVRTSVDCTNGDCRRSAKFPADNLGDCARACETVLGCGWWYFSSDDGDNTCHFQGNSGGFVQTPGTSSGKRGCTPLPAPNEGAAWPACVIPDTDLHFGKPLFGDVRAFINHPDDVRHKTVMFASDGTIGMGLREQPHDLGELVSDIVPGSQAQEQGVQRGWIIKEIDGKPFSKTESTIDVAEDFNVAKKKGDMVTVKFDVKSNDDCTNGDCTKSDKFPAASQDVCAAACSQLTDCGSWSFATEGEDQMCWLRQDAPSTLRAMSGSVAGSSACRPGGSGRMMFLAGALLVLVVGLARGADCMMRPVHVLVALLPAPVRSAAQPLLAAGKPLLELAGMGSEDFAKGGNDFVFDTEDEFSGLMGEGASRRSPTTQSSGWRSWLPSAPSAWRSDGQPGTAQYCQGTRSMALDIDDAL